MDEQRWQWDLGGTCGDWTLTLTLTVTPSDDRISDAPTNDDCRLPDYRLAQFDQLFQDIAWCHR